MIKTRFAPSPTGMMHIGGVRTALYEYLVAKKGNGVFSLRIEDTDRNRLVEGATEDIIENIKWLGLNFDEKPIVQSERKEVYQKYAKELVDKGLAYQDEGAVRFQINKDGQTKYHDLIGDKDIVIENSTQEDFVILKSDGFPTYNFANVIDDHLMEITHVIRGNEYISSMPKYLQLYKSFNWDPPQFAHLPLILGTDRSKLSKRHGAKGVSEFRQDGFLPEAILNYMAFLGWTPKSGKEILTMDEMIKEFDLKDVHATPAVFDITKLEWMNGEYIRKSQNSDLKSQIRNYLLEISDGALTKGGHPTEEEIEKVIPLIKERIKKLSDFVPLTDFLWEKPEYDQEIFNRLKINDLRIKMEKVLEKLNAMEKPWKAEVFEKTFRRLAEELELSASQMFQLIRIAISGQTVTPPLFESILILGEEVTVERVKEAAKFLQSSGS